MVNSGVWGYSRRPPPKGSTRACPQVFLKHPALGRTSTSNRYCSPGHQADRRQPVKTISNSFYKRAHYQRDELEGRKDNSSDGGIQLRQQGAGHRDWEDGGELEQEGEEGNLHEQRRGGIADQWRSFCLITDVILKILLTKIMLCVVNSTLSCPFDPTAIPPGYIETEVCFEKHLFILTKPMRWSLNLKAQ